MSNQGRLMDVAALTAEPGVARVYVDARCGCDRCEERTPSVYWMVGSCSNCGTPGILILYRAGDKTTDLDCPVCENWHSVRRTSQRLATADEIPAPQQEPT